MKKLLLGALLAGFALPASVAIAQPDRSWSDRQHDDDSRANQRQDHHSRNARDDRDRMERGRQNRRVQRQQRRAAWQEYNRYDYNRYDPQYGNYEANRYYRDGSYYQDRQLNNQDRIYRGSNDRYYCRRSDGTTGLIIGAAGGSLLGRAIARNGSKTLGTILGGVGGALIGRSIGRQGVRCN
jgi:Glycine zipper 2TM domain